MPSNPGPGSTRTDLGLVKKIQREGKDISQASGGKYGERRENQSLAAGAPTAAMPQATTGYDGSSVPSISAFAPGNPDVPLSEGSPFGPGSSQQQIPVDDFDSGAILARALFAANPTSQLARLVEVYEELGM